MQELELRRTDFEKDSEMDQLITLQNEVYKERGLVFEKELYIQWYLRNPAGRVLSFNAFDGGKMVAHYACIPKIMQIDGRVVKGLLSMATVTHPNYRGRGLFKKLAQMTYDYGKEQGYEFVVGVANANSFHGFIKYLGFTFVEQLQLKIGYCMNVEPDGAKTFCCHYDKDIMDWRAHCGDVHYAKAIKHVVGTHGSFVRTYMGTFEPKLLAACTMRKNGFSLKPLLYVGIGAKVTGLCMDMPKFVKHSPFNLIFKDLTEGKLPQVTRDNIFFQLWDYDVA